MRIFTAVRHSLDARRFYGGLWAENFHPALRRLGHEVVESQTDLLAASRFMDAEKPFTEEEQAVRGDLTDRIVREIEGVHSKKPVDLVLTYFYDSHFDPAGFAEIRRLGVPSVNFYCNSIHQFELAREVSAAADFAWHAERDAEAAYRAAGANPVWVQMAADPEKYHPVDVAARRPAACFVGQRYADRDRWIASLVRAGLPIELYGAGWRNGHATGSAVKDEDGGAYLGRRTRAAGSIRSYVAAVRRNVAADGPARGSVRSLRQVRYRSETRRLDALLQPVARGPIPFDEMLHAFSGCEAVLNFSNVWADGRPGSRLIPHVRLRDFEAPMCRCCYLTGHSDEIGEFYELGREIETYRSEEELCDKVRFYLGHPAEAERLRSAGFQRATRDHTWENRFRQLFRVIGLSR